MYPITFVFFAVKIICKIQFCFFEKKNLLLVFILSKFLKCVVFFFKETVEGIKIHFQM